MLMCSSAGPNVEAKRFGFRDLFRFSMCKWCFNSLSSSDSESDDVDDMDVDAVRCAAAIVPAFFVAFSCNQRKYDCD